MTDILKESKNKELIASQSFERFLKDIHDILGFVFMSDCLELLSSASISETLTNHIYAGNRITDFESVKMSFPVFLESVSQIVNPDNSNDLEKLKKRFLRKIRFLRYMYKMRSKVYFTNQVEELLLKNYSSLESLKLSKLWPTTETALYKLLFFKSETNTEYIIYTLNAIDQLYKTDVVFNFYKTQLGRNTTDNFRILFENQMKDRSRNSDSNSLIVCNRILEFFKTCEQCDHELAGIFRELGDKTKLFIERRLSMIQSDMQDKESGKKRIAYFPVEYYASHKAVLSLETILSLNKLGEINKDNVEQLLQSILVNICEESTSIDDNIIAKWLDLLKNVFGFELNKETFYTYLSTLKSQHQSSAVYQTIDNSYIELTLPKQQIKIFRGHNTNS